MEIVTVCIIPAFSHVHIYILSCMIELVEGKSRQLEGKGHLHWIVVCHSRKRCVGNAPQSFFFFFSH